MLSRIFSVIIVGVIFLYVSETVFNSFNMSSASQPAFNSTSETSAQEMITVVYKWRYFLYGWILIVNIVFCFVPMVETEVKEEDEEGKTLKINRKQTYLDYVKERMQVERLMS